WTFCADVGPWVQFKRKRTRPVLLQSFGKHDAARPLGRVEQLAEDGRGLRVVARLAEGSRGSAEALALLRSGAVTGLSFGYRVRDQAPRPGGGRDLKDLELIEVSLVTFPMQPLARVHALETGEGLVAPAPARAPGAIARGR
ncbi:MAG: HK97 family phage prohead protease, partial [Sphingomonadaceae bacterium]